MSTDAKRWTVVEMIRWTAEYLGGKNVHNARLNAELLLAGVLGLKRLDLYLQFDRPLSPEELAEFKDRLRRRARREPLQYIDGTAAFRDLVLRVDPRVLIPRPETEALVQEVLDWTRGRDHLSAVDVGTGSGAIALALATEGPFARVVATDAQPDALAAARENHALTAPDAPVEFRLGDLLAPVAGETFDVVVSNPPYVGDEEAASLDAEVRDWEPATALFAGVGGLDVIRRLVPQAAQALKPGGLLAMEIGAAQGAAVRGIIEAPNDFSERDEGRMEQIWERAREVGRQIAQSSEYQSFKRASQGLSDDREAVTRLNRLQALEESFTQLMQQGQEPPVQEQEEYERLVGEVQVMPGYQALAAAQGGFDRLMLRVNEEIAKGIEAGEKSRIILSP